MKRKKIIWVVSSILIIILLVFVIIKLTCIVNLDDGSSTSISDAEYLDVSDLRKLYIFIDNDEKNLLEELTKTMIWDSYYNNGFNEQYTTIVSNDIFERLNPNKTISKFDFELISVDVYCLCNEDKAIVFFTKECSMQSNSNKIECKITAEKTSFNRLYFEKIDGEWKVVSYLQQA